MSLATRTARLVGVVTVCLVAAIPIASLASELETILTPTGMAAVSNPIALQAVVFGSVYAAMGDMRTSFVFSIVLMQLLRYIFETQPSIGRTYFRDTFVDAVQQNVFQMEQQPSSDDF